jgi:heme/copper-type cytochrome/quinol oxidase subunit 1
MLIALFLIGLLGCIVWGHHMFAVGFDIDSRAYFTSSTSIIGVPTGIKLLNWLLTLWANLYYLITPLFFIIGFLLSFSFGGFTGLILANSIIDLILHDSYFVVGHFHYVLSLGAVYAIFASFYTYSLFLLNFSYNIHHKSYSNNNLTHNSQSNNSIIHNNSSSYLLFSISSIAFNDFIGRLAYIAFFISSNLLFFPMHSLGIFGFPRRIFDYSINFYRFHWLSSLSLIGIGFSLLLFLLSFFT